jgi:DNA polymerase-3 subunit delta'
MARAPALSEIEEFPEADRLEGFPHPRETVKVFGHESAEREFADAFSSGRIHHAWLISGPRGIGKATLAYRIARFLLASQTDRDILGASLDVPLDAPSSRQVRALAHPGLLLIRRPYDTKSKRLRGEITVEEVRRIKSFLSVTSDEGAWRVVIVDPADDLNTNAANALLKSLEEPPPRTIFLLVSSVPGGLLPTIRSRCRTLSLTPLKGDDLRRAVGQVLAGSPDLPSSVVPEAGEWPLLERLSEGRVRAVLSLKGGGGLDLYNRTLKILGSLPKIDWTEVHTVSDELSSPAADQRFELFYEQLLGLIARLIHMKTIGSRDVEEAKLAQKLISEAGLAHWASMWETIAADKALALALNLDRKAVILGAFAHLERAARL